MGETVWPEGYDPPPDGWEWKLVDVACAHCGADNKLHEQPPQWLETESGVVWECNSCGGKNRLGGVVPVKPSLTVLECGQCHATFDPNNIEIAEDGSWTCPAIVGHDGETPIVCEVVNRDVSAAEHAEGVTAEVVG